MTSHSAQKKPVRTSILARPLAWLVRVSITCRYLVLFLAVAGAVSAGLYTRDCLTFRNKRLDLINPKSEWNQYWLDYIEKFGCDDDLIVAVDGETPEEITAAVDDLAAEISREKSLFYSLFYRVDDSRLVAKCLHYASLDELRGLQMFLQTNEGVFRNDWSGLSVDRLLTQSTQPLLAPPGTFPTVVTTQCEQTIDRLITSLEGVFGSHYYFVSPFPEVDIASRRSLETTDPNNEHPERATSSETPSEGHSAGMFPGMRPPRIFSGSSKREPVRLAEAEVSSQPAPRATERPSRGGAMLSDLLPVGSYMAHYPDGLETPEITAAPSLPESSVESVAPQVQAACCANPASVHYLWAVPNKTAILMVKMVEETEAEFARGTRGIETIRKNIADVQKKHSGVQLQLTGLPVMENDEMSSSQEAMSVATWLSVLGVTLLYMIFFRGLRHPIMAVFALFIGIGWSLAYITFFIGHLNILSISFTVILVGLGIDFGIHYTSRYLQCRREGDDTRSALIRSGYEVGPGIATGALTTAAAFYMAGLTEFTGVAELGMITGGGILLCCLSALTVLPIFIYMSDRNRPLEKLPVPKNPNEGLALFQLYPQWTLPIGLILVVALGCGMKHLWYDYNLLNLQQDGLESVALEKRLIEESKQSVWYALSLSSDRETLLKRMEAFDKLPSVERVEQIVTLIPESIPERDTLITQIHSTLEQTPLVAGTAEILSIPQMERCFTQIVRYLESRKEYTHYRERIARLRSEFHALTPHEYFRRMQEYQKCLAEDLLCKFRSLQQISSPEKPSLADLPESLVDRFRAKDGTFLLKVYGKGDLWDMDNLEKFVNDVRSVDAEATGNPLQTYECSLQMKACYEQAAWYALIIVVFLLYLDLQSIRHTLIAILPVFLGMICTFGIMGYLNIPLNSANMIVLPLILGIGIDDGVHIVHDFRHNHQKGFYRLSPSTSMSVILTSFTTILGFGTLMVASHRGLQSLGIVLSLGVMCCWLTSLLILPALLSVFCGFAEEGREPEEAGKQRKISPTMPHLSEARVDSPRLRGPVSRDGEPTSLHVTRYTLSPTGEVIHTTGKAA
ncbi:MAG: MMPL family transporter [Planctomycetia bacterium]|nr:MMPL family transporter [Planctomycetia bacterium]